MHFGVATILGQKGGSGSRC